MTAITMPKAVWRDSEELTMFEDSVRGFFAKEAPPEVCAKWRENGIVDREMWTKAGQAGLLCVSMPEEFGGGGGDFSRPVLSQLLCQGLIKICLCAYVSLFHC